MGAQRFNLAPKFPQNGGFLAPNFVRSDENCPTRRKISDRLKLSGEIVCCTTCTTILQQMKVVEFGFIAVLNVSGTDNALHRLASSIIFAEPRQRIRSFVRLWGLSRLMGAL